MKKKNRIWFYSSLILGFVLIFTNSCKKDENSSNPGNNNTTFPKSYVVGYESNGTMNVAKYWKDGVATSLSDGNKNAEAFSIFVSGTDIYAAGLEDDSPGELYDDPTKLPKCWKNGVEIPLNVIYFGGASGPNGIANSVYARGSSVYVVGYEEDGSCNDYAAVIWENGGDPTILSNPDNEDAWANSVFVTEGGDVYVVGARQQIGVAENQATLWMNGIESPLTDGNNTAVANSVFVSGSDVYICGGEFNSTTLNWAAVYWKNGAITYLTDGKEYAEANSIYVSGNNVYVAGGKSVSDDGSMAEATYWKNGVATSLTPKGAGMANSIYVKGSDVYVGGTNESKKYVATCWKNGTTFPLTDGSKTAFATGIFVP